MLNVLWVLLANEVEGKFLGFLFLILFIPNFPSLHASVIWQWEDWRFYQRSAYSSLVVLISNITIFSDEKDKEVCVWVCVCSFHFILRTPKW